MLEKRELRKEMLAKRDNCPDEIREKFAKRICNRLWETIQDRRVEIIHTFVPIRSEVNIAPLLEKALAAGMKLITSKTLRNRTLQHLVINDLAAMETGIFGTLHPAKAVVYPGTFDLIIVPGLAFDKRGNRVGYGVGHYDKFLAEHPKAYKVGVAFPFQIVGEISVEPHDVRLDAVIWE